MLKIGLTGGIGSGKSTVAKIFELLNVPVYYADAASKELYLSNEQLMESIKKHFGKELYAAGGFDRVRMAQIVFSDPAKLELLNSLVHPLAIQDAKEWMERQTTPYVVKEAALIFESGSHRNLDYVVGVQSPEVLRIRRVMHRDGLTWDEVKLRLDRQMNEEDKMALCQFIVHNDEEHLLLPQVILLHEQFLKLAAETARDT